MKIIKRVSVLSILVIISFLFVGCDNKNEGLSEFRTYSNDYYTIQYPSNWLEPVDDRNLVIFSTEDNQISLKVTATRIYPYTENYIQEILKQIEKDINVEECSVGGNRGYKIKLEVNDEIITTYILQEKDIFLEMNFVCQANDYNNYQSLINQIKNTFEFNDFATLRELNHSPKVNGDRDAKWLADIEFISKQLPKNHKNLFFKVEEEEFLANVKSIKEKIPTLTDDEMIVEVSRLIASIGDSHTSFVFNSEESYPLKFYYFNDGIYLLDSVPEYSEYIGFKLKGINGKSVEAIIELFRPIIPHENESWFKRKFAKYIILTEFLNGLKITDSETVKFIFMDKNGNEESVEVKPSQWGLQNGSADKSEKMLYLKNSEKNYWYEFLEEEKLLYFQYNVCYNMKGKSFSDFNNELFDFIDNNSINKFVIDLRNNGGGSALILDPFFAELKKRKSLDHHEKLFVIVGRNTFSSAIQNTLKFENETNATFIGEPTGAKPNHYGEVQRLKLSNTNTETSYSTQYFEPLSEDIDSFVPDIIVEPNADDYFNNIDSVMVRILEIN
ncbi:hypothetical protein [Oceanirhabdus seepicola]|uniref:Tail specific protease domain-containing protein n=1 Tax=Oceanirhabdus seepicola TaxID=2828781 RepID=A0A9J6NVD4_9CLOT|nr:hypothetical protein [Oceanirhabdus seepicola]MCM1988426.1 hypothetical protein [Oceanirhabdus seepicola]